MVFCHPYRCGMLTVVGNLHFDQHIRTVLRNNVQVFLCSSGHQILKMKLENAI